MQIVSLHEVSNPVSRKTKKNITNMSSAEFAQKVVRLKKQSFLHHMIKKCQSNNNKILSE